MGEIEKTVFISYRRKNLSWALLVYKNLTEKGFDVFFDYTSIPSGDFEQIILSNIKARAHFLVVLTPTALDRCDEPGDWLRREIETALHEKRNIIPLFFDGFSFEIPSISKNLTGVLGRIKRYNGLDVPPGYFDAAMEKLCNQFLNVTLDAVLHPISDEVREVVKEQQIAANNAISPRQEAEEHGKQDNKEAEELEFVHRDPEELKKQIEEESKRENYASMESLLEKDTFEVKLPNAGEVRKGVIVSISPSEIWVNVGAHSEGIIPASELEQISATEREAFKVGQDIPVYIVTTEAADGYMVLSFKQAQNQLPLKVTESKHDVPIAHLTSETQIYMFSGVEFVKVPSGKFIMGSKNEDKSADGDENPQHTVDIPFDYYISRCQVTNQQYAEYVSAKNIKHPVVKWEKKRNHPVVDVSWNDVMEYCNWLERVIESEMPTGLILRLPTEAEWEKAARGKKGLLFPWGNHFDKSYCNTNESEIGSTTPVGMYSPQGDSPFGCADMSGNVWEWTHSLFKPYPYKVDDGREDTVAAGDRVIRGGSFRRLSGLARCASRGIARENAPDIGGFRVVISEPFA